MAGRIGEGNGQGKELVDVQEIGSDCILVVPNVQKPPPRDELHVALAEVMQKWLAQHPVRVRATLPLTNQADGGDLSVGRSEMMPRTCWHPT